MMIQFHNISYYRDNGFHCDTSDTSQTVPVTNNWELTTGSYLITSLLWSNQSVQALTSCLGILSVSCNLQFVNAAEASLGTTLVSALTLNISIKALSGNNWLTGYVVGGALQYRFYGWTSLSNYSFIYVKYLIHLSRKFHLSYK